MYLTVLNFFGKLKVYALVGFPSVDFFDTAFFKQLNFGNFNNFRFKNLSRCANKFVLLHDIKISSVIGIIVKFR